MNRIWYGVLWVFEAVAIVVVALLLMLPIQDYVQRVASIVFHFGRLHYEPLMGVKRERPFLH